MTELAESESGLPVQDANQVRHFRSISILLLISFAAVGIIFLTIPGGVIIFFNNISQSLGMAAAPAEGVGFYLILAVGYMYVVSYLAYLMYCLPTNPCFVVVLINAKSASSILSIFFFVFSHPCVILLINALLTVESPSGFC